MKRTPRKVLRGLRTIALYCTRRGELPGSSIDWESVSRAIEDDRSAGRLSYDQFTWARFADNGLREGNIIAAPIAPAVLRSSRLPILCSATG